MIVLLLSIISIAHGFLLPSSPNQNTIYAVPPIRDVVQVPNYNLKRTWSIGSIAFSLLPLSPRDQRATVMEEVVKGKIWTLDQIQGIIMVNVPVRCAVVKLQEGGLLVYNPVAPTAEALEMIAALEQKHGKVKYIVLGTLGLEHKALAGPFCRFFRGAEVWLQPGQWSFPLELPPQLFGFPLNARTIPQDAADAPWFKDFDHACLGPLKFKSVGGFGETAMFHRCTNTLIVTDAVIAVSDSPPPILVEDPRPLLFHSRDTMLEVVEDTDLVRRKGYRRMVLFSLFFFPAGILVSNFLEAFAALKQVTPAMKRLGEGVLPISGGFYPWSWVKSELDSFKALQKEKLIVAPILRKIILDREPARVVAWADKVSRWDIKRIVPCHMDNNVKASGRDFRRAFEFLEGKPKAKLQDDYSLLNIASELLTKFGIVAESRVPA